MQRQNNEITSRSRRAEDVGWDPLREATQESGHNVVACAVNRCSDTASSVLAKNS